ncbi:2-oxoisovalerate dehydrogenase subunit mitochondrial-like [Brachionus plicatilis]|uniref:2-oxoisovalerate dehydrogenase subunit alpha n=1 Tax=Brachionus plicatilis TaxID=10195 RepID=A0A3M7SFT3_BRAPC|nr:2-oxoisovalerate dehydrogenase subunit mitochondrial-like [Brachionus plicatilis]
MSRSFMLKSLKALTNSKKNILPNGSFCSAKRYTGNATSVSDRAAFPGYTGEFTSNLEFIYPENNELIQCYRVMNRKSQILDPTQDPNFDRETCEKILKTMITLGKMDTIMYEAQRQGRISFYMPNHGETAAQLGSAHALNPDDLVFAQYREAGVVLWRGLSMQETCDQIFGNANGTCKGRQMPVHYGSKELSFVTISSTIATQLPQAVGAAYALKRKQNGLAAITYFGDGGSSEGDTHAAMNFASVFDVPVIFFCRNNGYAISTSVKDQYRGDGIAARGPAYGIVTIRVDGNDLFAVYNATRAAREIAVKESRPVLIEAMTYRLGHHSTSDDSTAYRSIDEMHLWEKDDNPVKRFKQYVINRGWWDAEKDEQVSAEAQRLVMECFHNAEKQKRARPQSLFDDVYDKLPAHLEKQRNEMVDHVKMYRKEYPLDFFINKITCPSAFRNESTSKLKEKVRKKNPNQSQISRSDSDIENVKCLLRRRSACIDMSSINNSGLTAFHHAVLENSIELVKLMLDNNADINCVDEDYWTPLHTAASLGYYEVSKLLLQHGADWRALTLQDQRPFDLIEAGDAELKNLFLKYMNEPCHKNKTSQNLKISMHVSWI